MKTRIQDVVQFMEKFAPKDLAEEWDNVGLLIGRHDSPIDKVMTCLTLTRDCVDEAIQKDAQLVVTHHPLPFRSLKRITDHDETGKLLLDLIQANVGVYSPHTCFDSAPQGINQQIAKRLELMEIQAICPVSVEEPQIGSGRIGTFNDPISGNELIARIQVLMNVEGLHVVGQVDRECQKVAIACGAAGAFLSDAFKYGCDTFITGETNFHTCLDARAKGVLMLLPGHYATERFAVETLADLIAGEFETLVSWASQSESDPLFWMNCK